ncbi:drug/metabolite transporter (DMT)-like permease [Microbacterium halimionae]|uniref:Drug/metabolite transporter (DMT)-like permease n=1 Tax=Microbacterium halimionae TaxID=1526413 RepID=A0A7W3PLI2_9MICO|nr:drug/metabolite transporter (DMT)-like permease [Microbacterium halimionae]NII96243.1 drug/metabolite transporter (DMT)-like permease [Microbacterium halimionae]
MSWFSPTLDDVSNQLVGVFDNPALLLGIPLALAGAVFMSFGAQYQHRGVTKVGELAGGANSNGLTLSQLGRLLTRPSWVLGTVMLGLAIVCQLGALSVAPLIVVQPLGAISLVITTLLNARVTGHTPTRRSITAIIACVGGIFLFVTVAALFAVEQAVTTRQISVVLVLLFVISVALVLLWLLFRRRKARALFYVIAAGIVYGFVATLAKIVILRLQAGNFDWLTLLSLLALVAGTALGAYFVQTAYSSGPPDLAIAGLTVVDPMVAVVIGLAVLGEGSAVPIWGYVIFVVAGAIAIWGVINLAIYHPQVMKDSQELKIQRGSGGLLDPDETD